MKLIDAVSTVWSIGSSVYDYLHTRAIDERIHSLESVIVVHKFIIGFLVAGFVCLFTYIIYIRSREPFHLRAP